MDNILIAFLLTSIAGLSTTIGGFIAIFVKKENKNFLPVSLGFSAGVMIYVSFMEILPDAKETLIGELGLVKGNWITLLAFFGGIIFIALIDRLIPKSSNPHENINLDLVNDKHNSNSLMRMGLMTALAITILNFPEGLATFIASIQSPVIALPIVIAIAIHNIPEGVAVAVPIYYATGSKKKALFYSMISGLAEPLGALIGWLILMPFISDTLLGVVFAAVAGIMIFISFDELLPTAHEYGKHHLAIYGLVAGMVFMALSLLLFI